MGIRIAFKMKKIEIAFTDKESTPWGGLSLLHRMLERMQIEEVLEKIPLPQQGSNRGYSPKQIIQNFWVGVWSGANCLEHLEVTRHDALIREIFDCKQMAGSRAFQKYSNKFTQSINQEVFTGLYKWFLKNLHFDNYTMDFGSNILTRYGDQDGSKKGTIPRSREENHIIRL